MTADQEQGWDPEGHPANARHKNGQADTQHVRASSPLLVPPQTFVSSRHARHKRLKHRRKKIVVLTALLIVLITLGIGGFRVISRGRDAAQAKQVADAFVRAEFSGDSSKAMSFVAGQSIREDDLKAVGVLLKSSLKAQPASTGQDLQQTGDSPKGVVIYAFTINNAMSSAQKQGNKVYLVVLLQKDKSDWRVKNQTLSTVEPKADVASYSAEHFDTE